MRLRRLVPLLLGTVLAANAALAEETVIARDVLGPEGPLFIDGSVYFVGWVSSTLARTDGKTVTVLNNHARCGHNGIALTQQKTLMLACTEEGAIMEVGLDGKELRRWEQSSDGKPFTGGINDLVTAANGGVYATVFGVWGGSPGAVVGKVVYLAPKSDQWVVLADDLNYSNGIGVSPDQKTLYVAETVGNSIKKFTINTDGSLTDRTNFALLNVLVPNKKDTWWIGPDSLKVDSKGDLYVAQWAGGKILKLSPDGKLLHVFEIAAGDGTTNVAFGPGEKDLYVSVVKDPDDPQARGSIVKIANVP